VLPQAFEKPVCHVDLQLADLPQEQLCLVQGNGGRQVAKRATRPVEVLDDPSDMDVECPLAAQDTEKRVGGVGMPA